ncbi:energy transducer TonB [Erythrobacter sp.]|nr:energy transducer TonB [Erythrobacter sp.]
MYYRISKLPICVAMAAASHTALASNDKSIVLEPSSNWHLDYADERCAIGRSFGSGDEKTVAFFQQAEPSDSLHWVVGGWVADRIDTKFEVQFGPGFEQYEMRSPMGLKVDDFGTAVRGTGFKKFEPENDLHSDASVAEPVGLPQLNPDEGSSIEWVEFVRGDRSYRLRLGNLEPVYKAMNACMTNLVTSWGADPDILRQRRSPPQLINPDDVRKAIQSHYPSTASALGAQADLQIRAMVEADGTVSKCHITGLTQADRFDSDACVVLLQDARFEPARDLEGRPLASFYMQRIHYRMRR